MRLLLDTHILLWAVSAPKRLSKPMRTAVEDPNNEVMFSAASMWEIATKSTLSGGNLHVTPDEILATEIAGAICCRGPCRQTAGAPSRPLR